MRRTSRLLSYAELAPPSGLRALRCLLRSAMPSKGIASPPAARVLLLQWPWPWHGLVATSSPWAHQVEVEDEVVLLR
jgi:hypothetical protein